MLVACATLDQRTIADIEGEMWAQVFTQAGITLPDALQAVVNYHANPMSVDKRANVQMLVVEAKAIRRARMAAAGEPPFPPDLTVGQEIRWRRAWVEALGQDVGTAQAVADARLGIVRRNDPQVTNPAVSGQLGVAFHKVPAVRQ